MRKKALVSILAVLMTVICLAGCSGKGSGFSKSTIVDASKQYGMREAQNSVDMGLNLVFWSLANQVTLGKDLVNNRFWNVSFSSKLCELCFIYRASQ